MDTLGIVILIVGGIIYLSGRLIYKKTERQVNELLIEGESSDAEFLGLLNNGMMIVKVIGVLLVIAGAIIILIL